MSDAGNTPRARGGSLIVRFKGNRSQLFINAAEYPFEIGDVAVVGAERGLDAGEVRHVIWRSITLPHEELLYRVVRRASQLDLERLENLRKQEERVVEIVRDKVQQHELPMRVTDAEYRFDGMKLTIYFTSGGRVDFRELVRELAAVFRTRIELRQIGARDEVRRMDGFGVCGQQFCCVRFMHVFQPITTNMAKVQNLVPSPGKLSGRCGRLKCCMAFEFDGYQQIAADSDEPPLGDDELTWGEADA